MQKLQNDWIYEFWTAPWYRQPFIHSIGFYFDKLSNLLHDIFLNFCTKPKHGYLSIAVLNYITWSRITFVYCKIRLLIYWKMDHLLFICIIRAHSSYCNISYPPPTHLPLVPTPTTHPPPPLLTHPPKLILNSNVAKCGLQMINFKLAKLVFKFCAEHDSGNYRFAEFRNNLTIEMDITVEQNFARFEFKMRFRVLSKIAIAIWM